MAVNLANSGFRPRADRSFAVALILMMSTLFISGLLLLLSSDLHTSFPYLFLLPWIFGLAIILAVPVAILFYQGKFAFHNPLMFATFAAFIPGFVIGGLMLAVGWSRPFYLSFIQDADVNLPYTMILIMLGFSGLAVGYFLPVGKRLGAMIESYLPGFELEPSRFVMPGLILLGLGILNSFLAMAAGVIGYQKVQEIGTYDGLIFLTTLFWMEASFILWYIVFKRNKLDLISFIVIACILITAVGKTLLAGNRGGLLQVCIIVGLAYVLSGKQMNFRKTVWAGVLISAALIVGMIYGTTFRHIRGTDSEAGVSTYTENIANTFEQVGTSNNLNMLQFGLNNLAERVDLVSSVAVVVSTYEQLAPYEENYGLDNNIWKDITSFFIPRVIWNDKPVASDPQAYSDLYFNYGDNSFAITPFADLLRNYGVPGVFIGMLILGIVLRTMYRALIEDQPRILWRATLYFMLLTAVSYEGFYGAIAPFLFKVGTAAIIGLVIVYILARKTPRPAIR